MGSLSRRGGRAGFAGATRTAAEGLGAGRTHALPRGTTTQTKTSEHKEEGLKGDKDDDDDAYDSGGEEGEEGEAARRVLDP